MSSSIISKGTQTAPPGQFIGGPGDGAAGPLNAQENNSTYQQIQSPRDPASGQATGFREGGQNTTTYQKVGGTAQTGNALVYNESLTEARGTATAQPGQFMAGGLGGDGTGIRRDQPGQANNALVNNENIPWEARGTETANTGQWIGGSDDGSSIRKPRPTKRSRKGRRMHKP